MPDHLRLSGSQVDNSAQLLCGAAASLAANDNKVNLRGPGQLKHTLKVLHVVVICLIIAAIVSVVENIASADAAVLAFFFVCNHFRT